MAEIEGYTFAIDMEDRGVARGFQHIKQEATTMKNVMRNTFNELKAGEGTFSSLNYKIQETDRVIDAYKLAISRAKESMKELRQEELENGKMSDASERKYLRLGNTVASFQKQIGRLKIDQESARESLLRYNSGLDQFKAQTENAKRVMTSYVNELKSEGRAFATTKAEQQSYKFQKEALVDRYRAEVTETSRLRNQLTDLDAKYTQQKAKVASSLSEHGRLSQKYQEERGKLEGLGEKITETNGKLAKQSSEALRTRTSINEMSRAAATVNDGGITRLSRAMNNVSANAMKATSHTRAWAQSMRGGFMAATLAAAPLGAAMGKSVQMAASLQQSWINTSNILRTGAKSADEARKEVGRVATMQRDARKYSKEYGFSQKEIAEQYTELVKRGYSANQSIGSMKSMLEAARASGDSYGDVVKNVSSTVDAFGMRTNNTAKMIERTRRVTNAMAYAADMTATDFQGMGEAMSYVSASAHQAGQSVEVTTAAVGELSNAGIEGTRAGTGMRKVLNSLLAPTKGATDALNKYGMSMDDFKTKSGALKQLPEIMKIINDHTKNLGKADKGAFFKAVFGTTGQQAAMVLAQSTRATKDSKNAFEDLVKAEQRAEKHNYVHDLAQRNMQSTQMQLKLLQTNIQDLAITLGNKLLPAVNNVASAFGKWVASKQGQQALKEFSDSISGLANGVAKHSSTIFAFTGGFVDGMLRMFKWAGQAASAVGNLAAAIFQLPGMKGHGNGFAKFVGEAAGSVIGFVGVFKILKTTINGMSAVRQDIKNMFHMDGVDNETSKLGHENKELEENIALWKRHNEVSGGDSSVGSSITTNGKEKTSSKTISPKEKGNGKEVAQSLEKEAGPEMEKAGERSAGFFSRGFGRKIKTAGAIGADIFIQAFTAGGFDLDMVKWIGGKLLAPFKALAKAIKKIDYFPDGRVASVKGARMGTNYAEGVERGVKQHKKFKFSNWFKGSDKTASQEGHKTGESFTKSVTETTSKSGKKVSTKEMFSNTAKEAAKAGEKSGEGFVGKLGFTLKRTKTIPEIGKSLGGRIGGAATIAFGAVDLFKAVGSSNNHNRARKVGQSLGTTVGGAGGAAIGASLGSVVPGIGTAIGGLLGGTIGSIAGGKIGKSIGKAWPQIKRGASATAKFMSKAFQAPFKWAYEQGRKFGNWLNKQLGRKGKKSDNTMGAGNYSAKDRKLVQQMTTVVKGYTRALERLKKTKMGNYFKQMANEIKKSKLTKELSSLDKSTRNSAKNWRSLAKPLKQSASAFKVLQRSIKGLSGKKSGFTQLSKDVQNLYRTIRRNPFGKLIAQQANIANRAMSGKKSGFVGTFNRNVRSMDSALRSFRRSFDRDWRATWNGLDRPVSREMSSVYRSVRRYLDDINDTRSRFNSSFLKGWNSWIDDVVSEFRKGFSKLPNYAESAMKDIISRMNKGIGGVNKVISDFGGDKKLSSISYANGTSLGGHPGGHMMVNDSVRPHWKELVKFPSKPWMMFKDRNVFIPNAPQGTTVINGEQTHRIMQRMGVAHYDNGTDDSEEMIEKMEKNPLQTLKSIFFKTVSFNGAPIISSFGTALADGFLNAIKDKMKEMAKDAEDADSPAGTMSKEAFRKAAERAASIMGQTLSDHDIARLYHQAYTESNVNPAQGGGIDDHDGTGRPIGLFQFKWSTWNSAIRHLPANHHNIHSAVDQIAAVIADRTWRSDIEQLGERRGWTPHGYANGGFVGVHGLYEMAEENKLESIIPMDINKRPRALQLVNQTLDHMEQDGGGTGNIKRSNSVDESKFQNNVIALLGQIAGLSQQQIQAILTIGNNNNDLRSRRNRAEFYSTYGKDQKLNDFMSY